MNGAPTGQRWELEERSNLLQRGYAEAKLWWFRNGVPVRSWPGEFGNTCGSGGAWVLSRGEFLVVQQFVLNFREHSTTEAQRNFQVLDVLRILIVNCLTNPELSRKSGNQCMHNCPKIPELYNKSNKSRIVQCPYRARNHPES
jgi:hypothetical protein